VTDEGHVAAVKLLARATTTPPGPAGPFNITVPVDVLPPVTLTGYRLRDARASGLTVRMATLEVPPCVAVIVAETELETDVVEIGKLADRVPEAIVTEGGTFTSLVLEPRDRMSPPDGAKPLRVTVPDADVPPTTVVGETVPCDAVIVALTAVDTPNVSIGKVADEAPSGTVTDDGTMALVLPEARLQDIPPWGAVPLRVTVPVLLFPPITDVGETVKPIMAAASMVNVADF
jgi:hypothetical protein